MCLFKKPFIFVVTSKKDTLSKVATGIYVTIPSSFCNTLLNKKRSVKKPLFLLSHICYYTSEKWISIKRDTLSNVATGIYVTTPSPFCNILLNEKRSVNFFFFTYMLLHMNSNGLTPKKRYLAEFIMLLEAIMSPPPYCNILTN